MSSTLYRLRRRLNTTKKRHSDTISGSPIEHTDMMPVCIEHVYNYDVTTKRELTSERSGNTAPAISYNNSELGVVNVNHAVAVDISSSAASPNRDGKRRLLKQLPMISPKEEEEEMLSIPSIKAYSTVNYFEPSVEENNVDAHTYACDKMNHTAAQAQNGREITRNKSSGRFGVIEINLNDVDDVSDIESPEPLFEEEENNVCFQVFNEGLCATNTNANHPSNQMDDNDILSLPHLSVVTPDDGEKSRRENTSIRRRSHNDCLQSYVEDSYNDIIQALSISTKECGLTLTLDDIRKGLFQ